MKGMIFNIAESFISENFGEDTYDEIMASCSFKTKEPFVGPGTYPDEDMVEMLVKSSEKLQLSIPDILKSLGRYSFSKLASRHPNFLEGFQHPKPFLKTVDSIVHVEVKKLYSGAQLPTFRYSDPSEYELLITYYSERKLYPFMEGLIEGVGDYFQHPIRQTQRIYQEGGNEFCDFHLHF